MRSNNASTDKSPLSEAMRMLLVTSTSAVSVLSQCYDELLDMCKAPFSLQFHIIVLKST